MRRSWRDLVLAALAGTGRVSRCQPLTLAHLEIERHSRNLLDWDNAYGGLKPLLDVLVVPTSQNPDGLGLITDDRPSCIPEPPLLQQFYQRSGAGYTRIRIFAK